jgi:hypothetical protein
MRLGLGLGIFYSFNSGAGGSPFTTEYQAILNKAIALGYTLPSPEEQIVQDNYLRGLLLSGAWDELDVYYLFANNGSKEFATLNWKNPNSHQATLVNSPTFNAGQGFTFNGTSSYIDTNYNPSTQGVKFTQNSASRGLYMRTAPSSGVYMDGMTVAGNRLRYSTGGTPDQQINATATMGGNAILGATAQRKSIHRVDASNVNVIDGTTVYANTSTSIAIPNSNLLIGRTQSFYSNLEASDYYAGANLTALNNTFNTLFANYLAAL